MATKAKERFRRLLRDVDGADKKILSLFPSVNFHVKQNPQERKGLKTTLRVFLIAAEKGYVNHHVLKEEYNVGGDSRLRVLSNLSQNSFLTGFKSMSSKRVKKIEYRLSGKGVILLTAFPRLFESNCFVSLLNSCVKNESLARILLLLHHQRTNGDENRLMHLLHRASDNGLNIENLSDELIDVRLREAEKLDSIALRKELLYDLAGIFVDRFGSAKDEDIQRLSQLLPSAIKLMHDRPSIAKHAVILARDAIDLLWSPEFQIWLETAKDSKMMEERLRKIFIETIYARFEKLQDENQSLKILWDNRKHIIEDIRKKIGEETTTSHPQVGQEEGNRD